MTKFISPRARFSGELGGIKVENLKGLDFNIETLEGRLKEVRNKLEQVYPFFDEYFFSNEVDEDSETPKQYYKFNPNTTDELSEDINICKYIQAYGSYILNSKDLPRDKQMEYTILSEDRFKKILQREKAMSNFSGETDEDLEGLSMEQIILDTRPSNGYNNLDLKITNKDLDVSKQNNKHGVREKDIYLSEVLKDYMRMQECLKIEMSRIRNGEKTKYPLFKIVNLMSEIKKDMLLAKEQILGIRCRAKKLGDESPYNDFSTLDYKNPEHVKHMLKFCKITNTLIPDDMISHIGYDLQQSLKKLYKEKKIDVIDMQIVQLYNSGRYTFEEISFEVKRDKKTIQQRINKVCKRIVDVIE